MKNELLGELSWRQVFDQAMRPKHIVVLGPLLYSLSNVLHRQEPIHVQAFIIVPELVALLLVLLSLRLADFSEVSWMMSKTENGQ
jgi:hypothetical protein